MSCKDKWFARAEKEDKVNKPKVIFCEEPIKRFTKEDALIIAAAAAAAKI